MCEIVSAPPRRAPPLKLGKMYHLGIINFQPVHFLKILEMYRPPHPAPRKFG